MSRWPKDNPAALAKFYGDPAKGQVAKQLVTVKPPFHLWFGDKKVTELAFHKKAAPALEKVFDKIWIYYHKDQSLIDKMEISHYSGAYNHRLVRGSKSKWSNHAFGAAYDMDAEDNALGAGKGDIPWPVVAAFKSEGFEWGGDYKGRTDPMHFEACDRGMLERSFPEWLAYYDCPPMGADKKTVAAFSREKTPKRTEQATGEIVKDVQEWLKVLGYVEVGEIDGIIGSRTTGAIAAFMKDWGMPGAPVINKELADKLSKAVVENWKRPIAPERATATVAELTPKLPEVQAAVTAQQQGLWSSIVIGGGSIVTGLVNSTGDAVGMLAPIKGFFSEVPWGVWVVGALVVSLALYLISRKAGEAANAATAAYQEGARV